MPAGGVCNHHHHQQSHFWPIPAGSSNHCLQKNHFFLFIVSPTKLWSVFRQKMFLCKFWSKTGIFLYGK